MKQFTKGQLTTQCTQYYHLLLDFTVPSKKDIFLFTIHHTFLTWYHSLLQVYENISIQYYVSSITSTQPNRKHETIYQRTANYSVPSFSYLLSDFTVCSKKEFVWLLFTTLSSHGTIAYCRSMKTCLVLVCEYLS